MRPALSVLVIEDDPDLRDLVCQLLQGAGAAPLGVANAEDAANVLEAQEVDIVLCDYVLPGRNGATFLRDVRQRHPGVRCLAMTGYPDPFILGRGHDDGYFVLTKPVDPSLLLALVDEGTLPLMATVVAETQRHEAEKLKGINEFQTRFLGMVAHDLNNVLTPLKINVKMVGDELAQAGGEQSKSIDRLRYDVHRIQLFLADLLDASRLQSGQLTIQPRELDLAASLRETLEQVGLQAKTQDIRLETSLPAEARIVADPHRIEQVTTNLLSNALKFTPAGGTILVELKTGATGEVQVVVKDDGPGIAEDDILKLFEPFTRLGAAPQGKHTGTGLGLFICKGIIERHGGKISCESQGLGKGATFRFTLPGPSR